MGIQGLKNWMDRVTGRQPVDILFRGGRIADVMTGEIRESSLAVYGGRVAGLHDLPAEKVIDLQGELLVPGLIDAHVHIESSLGTPEPFARAVIPWGTTTVVADPHEIANVAGIPGIQGMMTLSRQVPLSVFYMLPSCVPAAFFEDSGARLSAEDLRSLMDEKDVLGLGELMDYPAVLAGDDQALAKILLAREYRKLVDGHAPGLTGEALSAYAAAGIGTDHESSEPDELLQKLRMGQYGLLREGSAARNLSALLKGLTPENSRRLLFCTDDRQPEDILSRGHINNNLTLAVNQGVPFMTALRMATLNAAEAYGLRDRGALVPGRRADFLILRGETAFPPNQVYVKGRLAAEKGIPLFDELPDHALQRAFSRNLRQSVRLAPHSEGALTLDLPETPCRIITLEPHSLVTGERRGRVLRDDQGWHTFDDQGQRLPLVKLAVFERHRATGKRGIGFLAGLGLTGGALGSTIAHDSHNLIVAGTDDHSMARVIQALEEAGGGVAAAVPDRLLGLLPLPIGGIMSDRPFSEVNGQLKALQKEARETLGVSEDYDPFMTLAFLALPVIPRLKLTARGLFDVEKFDFVSLEADPGE